MTPSQRPDIRRVAIFCALLGVALVSLFLLNIATGSLPFSVSEIWNTIIHPDGDSVINSIIWKIRIPRAIAGVVGGACLAVSGLLLQVYFRNPIVEPYILGVSSGATVMVSLVMLTTVFIGLPALSPFITTLAAFVGAYAVMMIIIAVSRKVQGGVTLLIIGLMMGYLCYSVTGILTALAEKEKIKGFVLWQLGSFSGFKWSEIYLLVFGGGGILVSIYALSKPLNAFLLGEEYASSMGVNISRFRTLLLLCACALTGMVTSMAGPVAFIGLAVPHMARLVFGTSDNRILIPGVCLLGASVTSMCDLIARMILSPVELPLSAITALFGAPIVISLLLKKKVKL